MRLSALVAASALLLPNASFAAQLPTGYRCEVKSTSQLNEAGVLKPTSADRVVGERFQLDAKTGEITGSELFSSRYWAKTTVLDAGTSQDGSYVKVMYSSPPRGDAMNVAYLQLQETINQPSRPFLFVQAGSVYTGICTAPR